MAVWLQRAILITYNKYHVTFLKSGENVLIRIVGTAWLARYENVRSSSLLVKIPLATWQAI